MAATDQCSVGLACLVSNGSHTALIFFDIGRRNGWRKEVMLRCPVDSVRQRTMIVRCAVVVVTQVVKDDGHPDKQCNCALERVKSSARKQTLHPAQVTPNPERSPSSAEPPGSSPD